MTSNNNNSSAGSGFGILGLLGVVFIVLKLCHVIAWSWWWVLCPFWGGTAIVVLILIICLISTILLEARAGKYKK